jgi:hypothetical protein
MYQNVCDRGTCIKMYVMKNDRGTCIKMYVMKNLKGGYIITLLSRVYTAMRHLSAERVKKISLYENVALTI